ncbi:TIGR02680 family protein, partial [Intestinibacter sp.]
TSKEFENALQKDKGSNVFTKVQGEYMKKVNEHLYGYSNIDDYKELLELLIQLRRPKLSKEFKPTVIYTILKTSLSTLSENDLRPMAEAMDNMDNLNEKIEELEKHLEISSILKNEIDNYNKYNLYIKSKDYNLKRQELKNKVEELENLKQQVETKKSDLNKNKEYIELLKIELDKAQTKKDNLKGSEAFKIKENIELEKAKLKKIENDLSQVEKKYDTKYKEKIKLEEEIETLESKTYLKQKELKDLLQDDKNYREDIYFNPVNSLNKDILEDENYNFSMLFDEINNYATLVSSIYSKIIEFENKSKEFTQITTELDSKKRHVKSIEEKLHESEQYLTTLQTETIEKINIYTENTEELKIEKQKLEEITSIINDITTEFGYLEVENKVKEIANEIKGKLHIEKKYLEDESKKLRLDIKNLEKEIESLESSKEIFDEDDDFEKSKKILDENDIDYEVFYKSIKFKENVEVLERQKIEKSLLSMGILNSFVIREKDVEISKELLKQNSYKILSVEENIKISNDDNLSMYLELEESDFNKKCSNEVNSILSFISTKECYSTYLDYDGSYKIGIIRGKSDSSHTLKYIGSKSREDYRIKKITNIKEEIQKIEGQISDILKSKDILDDKIKKLELEVKLFPNGDEIKASVIMINEESKNLDKELATLYSLEERYQNINAKYQALKVELFDMTEGVNIPNDAKYYKEVQQNINTYRDIIIDIKTSHSKLFELNTSLTLKKENLENINTYLDDISSSKIDLNYNLKLKDERIKSLEETLKSMDLGEVERELQRVSEIVIKYPIQIRDLEIKNARIETSIENDDKNINTKSMEIEFSSKIAAIYESILDDELNLKYINEIKDLKREESLKWILKNLNYFNKLKNNPINKVYAKINEYENHLSDYNLSKTILFDDYDEIEDEQVNQILKNATRIDVSFKLNKKTINIYELEKYLESTLNENKILINDREREVFEDILLNTLSTKINARIGRAKAWVKSINLLMNSIDTSNGLKLNLKWEPKKTDNEDELDIRKLTDMFKKSQFMTEEEKNKISEHFKIQLKKKKRELMEKDSSVSYQSIIKEVLDYRSWYEFKLMFSKDGKTKEMTDNEFFRLSGGEKAMSMYVPLFAAVNARYDSADKKDCPRIISLDEAFAGVDEKNIESMFKLLESLNLDYILNSQVLWGTYEGVKSLAIYELIRQGEDVVVPIRYTWNGKDRLVNI